MQVANWLVAPKVRFSIDYIVSGYGVYIIYGFGVEIPDARLVMRVGMANPFRLNGMETQDFPSAKTLTLFRGMGPAVQNHSSCQTQAKGAFDPLMHHKTK